MIYRYLLVGSCVTACVAGIAEARTDPANPGETPASVAALVLLDDTMIAEETTGEGWRVSTDAFERGGDGDFRLRVKLRPNRAMGRMSLSF